MRTIIAGSRSISQYAAILQAVAGAGWKPSVVLSGAARGVDQLGEMWGKDQGIPVERYPADWYPKGKLDRGAGHRRNLLMAEKAQALIAVWDGQSPGTKHMIDTARKFGLAVHVHLIGEQS